MSITVSGKYVRRFRGHLLFSSANGSAVSLHYILVRTIVVVVVDNQVYPESDSQLKCNFRYQ